MNLQCNRRSFLKNLFVAGALIWGGPVQAAMREEKTISEKQLKALFEEVWRRGQRPQDIMFPKQRVQPWMTETAFGHRPLKLHT